MWVVLIVAMTLKSTQVKDKKQFETTVPWYENCQFPARWDMEYVPVCQRKTRRVSKPYCLERTDQHYLLEDLGIQMKRAAIAEDVDGVVAMNFDVPYRILYYGEMMVNPEVVETSEAMKTCYGTTKDGKQYVRRNQHVWLRVHYLTLPKFIKKDALLKGKDSCVMQSLLDDLNNVCPDPELLM